MSDIKGISDNRGGARRGAGRKPIYEISENELEQLVSAAKKKAKETGKSLADVLIDLAYQTNDKRTALQALRIYFERVIVKNTEKDITINQRVKPGPLILSAEERAVLEKIPAELKAEINSIYPIQLPAQKPDPAKQITSKNQPKKNKVIKLEEKKI